MNQISRTLLHASIAIGWIAGCSAAQAQSPAGGLVYTIDQAGLGIWGSGPAPHVVIRAPLESAGDHSGNATIPYAVSTSVWKQPYAYGYFGVTPKRLPYRSFGHQQAFTEWRWR